MTALVENTPAAEGFLWGYLLQTWRELDVPEGWRAEIDEGRIDEPNEDGTYKRSDPVPFGKPLTLPEPFGTTVPTEEFPV
ncbi:hypothetical protein ACF07T_20880 [Streptomyces sp. NPDC015184]|uniref:hypothetical protein n=1 Tax=Streptomyces sp. NPDC015184 TaxID=3364946 RepID=UPI003701CA15